MKKIGFLLLVVLFLAACSNNPQNMAQKGVKTYLKENLEAPKTYEPVSFGKLDTISIETDATYKQAQDSLDFYMNALNQTADQFALAHNQKRAKEMKTTVSDLKRFYEIRKYKIEHKFKNKKGEQDKEFYLDAFYHVVE